MPGPLSPSCLSDGHALMPQDCIFLCPPIKLSYNTGLSIASNFFSGEAEPRNSYTPLTIEKLIQAGITDSSALKLEEGGWI